MCLATSNRSMTAWLAMQVRVLEAWREEVAMRADIDLGMALRLERHYQWLTAELAMLDLTVEHQGSA